MEPTFGASAQVTAVFPDPPLTVAVNCWVWPADREAVAGETETLTGLSRVMIAVRLLPFNAAVKVAVWVAATLPAMAGNDAVVLPAETVTEPGTVSMGLLLESDTTVPYLDADRDKAMVHVVVDPEATVVGLQPKLLSVRGTEPISRLLGISIKQIRT